MGEWDFYCALCAGCFSTYGFLPEDGQAGNTGPRAGIPIDANDEDDVEDEESDDGEERCLDTTVMNERKLRWLTKLRIIGENPKATSLKRCFITGYGEPESYGHVLVDPGSHKNVPTEVQGAEYRNGRWDTPTYTDYGTRSGLEEWAPMPLHDACYQLLVRALKMRKAHSSAVFGGEIDLDILYSALCSRRSHSCLDLNYFEFNELAQEQFWGGKASWEPWLMDPIDIPQLEKLAKHLPRTYSAGSQASLTGSSGPAHDSDPFSKLPLELLHQIYDHLPAVGVPKFMLTSRATLRATHSDTFWKRRLALDMPYLWEILEVSQTTQNVDWREVYICMSFQSFPGGWDPIFWKDHKKRTRQDRHWEPRKAIRKNVDFDRLNLGLLQIASRRRVFDCVQQVLGLYLLRDRQMRTIDGLGTQSIDRIADTSSCLHMPRVAGPAPREVVPMQTFLLSRWSDVHSSEKALTMRYNKDGFLCHLSWAIGNTAYEFGSVPAGEDAVGIREEVVHLAASQWIEGLKLTIKDYPDMMNVYAPRGIIDVQVWTHSANDVCREFSPDKLHSERLLVPEPGHTLVGFKGDFGDGKIFRLGIIESHVDLNFPRTPCIDALTRKLLWRVALPPPHISVHQESPLPDVLELDMSPMDALYFGTENSSPDEWRAAPSKIVEIAGNVNGQSLQYAWERSNHPENQDRFTETIGKAFDRIKRFPIDGPGGERINGIACESEGRPGDNGNTGIRLVTNRNRQVVFGTRPIHHELVPPQGRVIAGVFGCYYRHVNVPVRDCLQHHCKAFGVFTAPGEHEQPNYGALKDEEGRPWEPSLPPPDWTAEDQPMLGGKIHLCNGDLEHMATWLDLTQPIKSIAGLYAAPTWWPILQLGGFVINHVDGSQCWTGAPVPTPPGLVANKEVDIRKGTTHSARLNVDPDSTAHVDDDQARTQNTGDGKLWIVDDTEGELISRINVWNGDFLNGIQFITASGKESPKWGKAAGHPNAVLLTPWSSAVEDADGDSQMDSMVELDAARVARDCVGLKFVLGGWRHNQTPQDPRPLGVQPMVMRLDPRVN